MNKNSNDTGSGFGLGARLAAFHFGAFLISAILANQLNGWLGFFIWPVWSLIDIPWSLLYLLEMQSAVALWVENMRSASSTLSYLLYSPYIIHGIIGTFWWALLPSIYFKYRHSTTQK